jgi:glycosyltransferase involved in cell wall biosynthesis
VHTHASAQARVAARLFSKAKTVNTRHCAPDGDFTVPLFKKTAISTFDKLFTDKTIATAHYVKAILISEGIPAEKISVIINGSIALKKLSDTERIEIRKTLGYSETDFLAGIVGRLEQEKGQEIFIEAARLCQSTAPQIKFLIAGSGSMEQRLKKQAQGLGNVKFLGFLPDVCEIMNVIDANVNCSYISETSSLSLSEGMSVGAIPVVSDCGGNRYLAKDCGIIIPPKNSLELANAIKLLSDDRQLLAKLGKKTQERFFNELTAKAMTIQIEALYKKLM